MIEAEKPTKKARMTAKPRVTNDSRALVIQWLGAILEERGVMGYRTEVEGPP